MEVRRIFVLVNAEDVFDGVADAAGKATVSRRENRLGRIAQSDVIQIHDPIFETTIGYVDAPDIRIAIFLNRTRFGQLRPERGDVPGVEIVARGNTVERQTGETSGRVVVTHEPLASEHDFLPANPIADGAPEHFAGFDVALIYIDVVGERRLRYVGREDIGITEVRAPDLIAVQLDHGRHVVREIRGDADDRALFDERGAVAGVVKQKSAGKGVGDTRTGLRNGFRRIVIAANPNRTAHFYILQFGKSRNRHRHDARGE